jgi:pimeloyl-ACP methyl ester carboxylesterase
VRRASAFRLFGLALLLVVIVLALPAGAAGHGQPRLNPVIFVHGGAGSGAQFESQKMRFTSNGYPERLVRVVEYDSTFGLNTMADVHAKIDQLIAELQQETGRPQVDILGHSLGTAVMQGYLNSSLARAANVAHYVNIDGGQAASPPGGVPTLAIWAGMGTPGRTIGGATNVTVPNQTHVQSATSAESFVEMYKFFTGRPPKTSDILPEHGRWIEVSGRAVIFPQNTGAQSRTLQVWEVRGSTGQRMHQRPVAVQALGGDGSWGPFKIKRGRHYEFALVPTTEGRTHHFYYEPFVRSDHLVRLLTSEAGSPLDLLTEKSPNHVSMVATRNKELWGDQGAENDVLEVGGTNVCNAATCPINKRVIGMFAFDVGSDGATNLAAPIPALVALPFLSGVDHFIPAAPGGTGKVSVSLTSRGVGPARTVNFPNRPSVTDQVTVQLNDFECPGRLEGCSRGVGKKRGHR